jgi:hypothetical protein
MNRETNLTAAEQSAFDRVLATFNSEIKIQDEEVLNDGAAALAVTDPIEALTDEAAKT